MSSQLVPRFWIHPSNTHEMKGPGDLPMGCVAVVDAAWLDAYAKIIAAADEMRQEFRDQRDPETQEVRCLCCGQWGNTSMEIDHADWCKAAAYDAARKL